MDTFAQLLVNPLGETERAVIVPDPFTMTLMLDPVPSCVPLHVLLAYQRIVPPSPPFAVSVILDPGHTSVDDAPTETDVGG